MFNVTGLPVPPPYVRPTDVITEVKNKDVSVRSLEMPDAGGNLLGTEVTINTGSGDDNVHIYKDRQGRTVADINGELYGFKFGRVPEYNLLTINTGAGNDNVKIDDDVDVMAFINTGDDDDSVSTGGSTFPRVRAGNGNDTVRLGKKGGHAYGENGDDHLISGDGHLMSHLHGGAGDNRLTYRSMTQVYLDKYR
ncbi:MULTISPECIES: hypothetical protein [Pseudomonas]|uniref:Uncharacterized protein n=2 Tax=Pseudomonas TaxID=286 RepID=A0A0D0TU50_PSEFL|nr:MULTISPECIES: hypothetical protein [Pseudomonas fluorescens group]AZE59956.1 Alkaline phosphatase [Pseudomonas synxantha]KIR24350.1 hypothetical protein PFLU3_02420 [Pseudomonas fluorescens]